MNSLSFMETEDSLLCVHKCHWSLMFCWFSLMLHKSGVIICVHTSNKLPVSTVSYPLRVLTSDQVTLMLYAGTNVMC